MSIHKRHQRQAPVYRVPYKFGFGFHTTSKNHLQKPRKTVSLCSVGLILTVCCLFIFGDGQALADENDHHIQPGALGSESEAAGHFVSNAFHHLHNTIQRQQQVIGKNFLFTAEGVLMIDAKTGAVLYEKNADETFFPASTTKIMTGLLALEYGSSTGDLREKVVTSERARLADGNRIYLEVGEETELGDLIYGIMLNSGNDAAIAIAEHIGGSVEGFAEMMNEKAEELGAVNTHFVNPNGLHDDEHVSTPEDLAIIARYALQNSEFREIVTTKEMPWLGQEWHSKLVNLNTLLWDYEGTTGVKTGYTRKAGQTYVGSAARGDTEFIVVMMKGKERKQQWEEVTALFDYGFDNFQTEVLKERGDRVTADFFGEEQTFVLEEDLLATVPIDSEQKERLEQQIEWKDIPVSTSGETTLPAGQEVGEWVVLKNGAVMGKATIALSEDTVIAPPQKSDDEQSAPLVDAVDQSSSEKQEWWAYWFMIPLVLLFIVNVYRRKRKLRQKEVKLITPQKYPPPPASTDYKPKLSGYSSGKSRPSQGNKQWPSA